MLMSGEEYVIDLSLALLYNWEFLYMQKQMI